jgi:peptidoglycan/LPS O-acetylase OafA/YrhL
MTPDRKPRRSRKRLARFLLIFTFLIVLAADALLFWFCFHILNPYPGLTGILVGSLVGSTALYVAIWRRQAWARYVLLALLWITFFIMCAPVLSFTEDAQNYRQTPVIVLVSGCALYLVAIGILTISYRIQQLLSFKESSRDW